MNFQKYLIRRISLGVLFCFLSLLANEAYPLPVETEQEGAALVAKGEKEYSEGFYQEALASFNRALNLAMQKSDRSRLLLGLSQVHFALGDNDKCSGFLRLLLENDPETPIDRSAMAKGFLSLLDQENLLLQQRLAEQKRIEERARAEELQNYQNKLALEKKKADEEKARVSPPQVQEKEQPLPRVKKKKKFPVLLVAAAIVAAGLIVFFLTKKPKYKLTVTVGEGIAGNPVSGTYVYKKGASVSYSYSTLEHFKDITVRLNGSSISASGSFLMAQDSTLVVSSTRKVNYTLTVSKGAGVSGTPNSGTTIYEEGSTVSYSYSALPGTVGLKVRKNGVEVSSSGNFTMDKNYILSSIGLYSLTISRGEGVKGSPASGVLSVEAGQSVAYSYSPHPGYTNCKVTFNGNAVASSSSIEIVKESTLSAAATWSGVYDIRGAWKYFEEDRVYYFLFEGTLKNGSWTYSTVPLSLSLVPNSFTYQVLGKNVSFSFVDGRSVYYYDGHFVSPLKCEGDFLVNGRKWYSWRMERY